MEKELLSNANDILVMLKNGLQGSIDIGKENIPILLKEMLNFGLAKASLFILLGVLIVLFGVTLFISIRKDVSGTNDSGIEWMTSFFWFIGSMFIIANSTIILKIILSPRLYLLEKIQYLIR